MTNFECNVTELPKKEVKYKNSKQVNFSDKELLEDSNIKKSSIEQSSKEDIFNTVNIKAFLVTLLVFLIINSNIIRNIILNSFDFLNDNGNFSVLGNILIYVAIFIFYFYLSSEDQKI